MPDWVTHLGTTYIAARAVPSRLIDLRYVLLGALLPDITRFTIILVDILDWPALQIFTYLIPFHSILITGLIIGAIAAILPVPNGHSPQAFTLMMAGALLHFLMDDLEGLIGCGSTTLYPFYFGKPISGWDSEGNFALTLLVVAAMAIGVAFQHRGKWLPIQWQLSVGRIVVAITLLGIAVIIPLFFQQRMIEQNAYYLGLAVRPTTYNDQTVELCFSEVIALDPLTIEEFDKSFLVSASIPLSKGEWVSVRGIYQDGFIKTSTIIRHRDFSDVLLSLIAAVAFVILVFDKRQIRALLTL